MKLYSLYQERNESNFQESRNAAWELAKFLFTANTGAAAGMFILVRGSHGNGYLIGAFFTFCIGVFFVGTAYFLGAVLFAEIALKYEEGVRQVVQGNLLPLAFIQSHREIVRGRKSQLIPIFGTLSFLCLLIGGVIAVKPFLNETTDQTSVATKSINMSVTNSLAPNKN